MGLLNDLEKDLSDTTKFDNNFKKFVLDNICQCSSVCENATPGIIKKNDPKPNCSEIKIETESSEYYKKLYEIVIQAFIYNKKFTKIGNKYYILKNKEKRKLTWENIKSLDDTNLKQILWLFRKLIIDTFLKFIVTKFNMNDLIIYSVGSNELTSDYDITLYGNTNNKVTLINEFNKLFNSVFNNKSSLVFDTNIYGKSYIEFQDPKNNVFVKFECPKNNFYYLKDPTDKRYKESCVIWALIKFFREIRDSFGEDIYNKVYVFMRNKQKTKLKEEFMTMYEIANETLLYLRNQDEEKINYETVINNEEYYKKKYKSHFESIGINDDELTKIQFENDNISLINFFGEETYFTRGAFLDTVVNSQICSNNNPLILSPEDYIASIIENSSFFFIHNNKTKYLKRAITTFKLLYNLNKKLYQDIYNSYEFNYMNSLLMYETYTNYIKKINDILLSNLNLDKIKELYKIIDDFIKDLQSNKIIDIDSKKNKSIKMSLKINQLKKIKAELEKENPLNISKIKNLLKDFKKIKIMKIINYKYCDIFKQDNLNLLDCEKYQINQYLLWLVYKITIPIQTGKILFPFYDINHYDFLSEVPSEVSSEVPSEVPSEVSKKVDKIPNSKNIIKSSVMNDYL